MAEARVEERSEKKEKSSEGREIYYYTIPLRRVYWGRRSNRAARAVKLIRAFVARHLHLDLDSVKISNEVNEYVWRRGIEKPPRYVRVRVVVTGQKTEQRKEKEVEEKRRALVLLAREKRGGSAPVKRE